MHIKDALAAGEDPQRLHLVAAWREATCFTEAERAALEVTEQGTRIADAAGGVTDDAWLNASKHYDDEQLAALIFVIAMINAFNRLNVINQQPAGGYEVGQYRRLTRSGTGPALPGPVPRSVQAVTLVRTSPCPRDRLERLRDS